MKTKFPKLQGFLIKPKVQVQPSKNEDEEKKKKNLDISSAFVYKGHLIAANGQILLIYNLKEYMKTHVKNDDGEEISNAYSMISRIIEYLEGKTLSKDFFTAFSKIQEFNNVDEFKMYVNQSGLHSEISIDATYDVELLESFLAKRKIVWQKERTEQGGYYGFSLAGSVYTMLSSVLSEEMAGDSLILERTTDDQARFCFANKDWVFGLCVYSIDGESSVTKFAEANDFFSENI